MDSLEGLAAYMNVFIRSNPLATEFKLNRVGGNRSVAWRG